MADDSLPFPAIQDATYSKKGRAGVASQVLSKHAAGDDQFAAIVFSQLL
jgi:hypothetical protein